MKKGISKPEFALAVTSFSLVALLIGFVVGISI